MVVCYYFADDQLGLMMGSTEDGSVLGPVRFCSLYRGLDFAD